MNNTSLELAQYHQMADQALDLISKLQSLSEENSATVEVESENVLTELSNLARVIAGNAASSVSELRVKGLIYETLAPELLAAADELTIDEKLIRSILADIKYMSEKQA